VPACTVLRARAISPTGIPTSNCINRNIARYRPARDVEITSAKDSATRCMLIGQKSVRSTFLHTAVPLRIARIAERGERTRRDKDRLSLLVSVTVGKVRGYVTLKRRSYKVYLCPFPLRPPRSSLSTFYSPTARVFPSLAFLLRARCTERFLARVRALARYRCAFPASMRLGSERGREKMERGARLAKNH
jgi:hypothetical protein